MPLQKAIKAVVRQYDDYYVAECLNINVVTQGDTLEETLRNLQDAVALYLEGEDLAELGLAPDPAIMVTIELEPAYATA